MAPKKWIVIGSGQRVREAALPVGWSLPNTWELAGVFSRTPKKVGAADTGSGEKEVVVERLEALTAERLADVELVYVVVVKGAVPSVLARLAKLPVGHCELLLETPVLLPKHLGHLHLTRAFRRTHVAEDCAYLPCLPAIEACFASGALGGAPRAAVLTHSAYAYHGVALSKALLGGARVLRARKGRLAGGLSWRHFDLDGGRNVHVLDPRDYSSGRIAIAGPKGVLADHDLSAKSHLPLEAITDAGQCIGFRAGDSQERMQPEEVALMGTPRSGHGLTVWMDGMKRVGLRRMLQAIAAGRGGYPLMEAVDDTLVDYHLEKLGWYRANPFTSARGVVTPLALKALSLAFR